MRTVGLTGAIGSGKSTVARLLAARGAVVLDADAITRELQRPGQPVHRRIVERFGNGVVDPDGSLDRQALARVVFADDEALAALEAVVHPAVREVIAERLAALAGSDVVVVLDVPLLVESRHYDVDGVVVVDCPPEVSVRRLVEQRGMTEADAQARLARQVPRADRLAAADVVIDNAGPLAALEPQVDTAWAWIESLPDR
ncbi:MAG TPA: dephospho-CoA kinase [Acidimicrobiales bacterium]|nr:dephospho-CoA kinase [Acidimicrobiales bacterium]